MPCINLGYELVYQVKVYQVSSKSVQWFLRRSNKHPHIQTYTFITLIGNKLELFTFLWLFTDEYSRKPSSVRLKIFK